MNEQSGSQWQERTDAAADATAEVTWCSRVDQAVELRSSREGPAGARIFEGRIARYGVMHYRTRDGRVIRELVRPETLRREEDLATLRHAPVTLHHPPEEITPANVRQYTVGNLTDALRFDEEGLVADIVVRDAAALHAIGQGVDGLSPGYRARVDSTGGIDPVFGAYDSEQLARNYNHNAIVDDPRGGASTHLRSDHDAVQVDDPSTLPHPREDAVTEQILALMAALGLDPTQYAGTTDKARLDAIAAKLRADAKARADAKDKGDEEATAAAAMAAKQLADMEKKFKDMEGELASMTKERDAALKDRDAFKAKMEAADKKSDAAAEAEKQATDRAETAEGERDAYKAKVDAHEAAEKARRDAEQAKVDAKEREDLRTYAKTLSLTAEQQAVVRADATSLPDLRKTIATVAITANGGTVRADATDTYFSVALETLRLLAPKPQQRQRRADGWEDVAKDREVKPAEERQDTAPPNEVDTYHSHAKAAFEQAGKGGN